LEGVTTVAEVRNGLRDLDEKVRVKVVDKLKKSENPNLATVFKNYEDLETMQSGVEDYVLRTEGSQGLEDAKEVLDQAIGTNESVEDVQAAVQATIKQYQEVISQEKKKGADSTEMKRDVIWMEESVQHLTTMLERYKRNIQSESVNKPDPTPSSQQPKNRGEE
jgi:Mg2+ and Co2+ transporter CorA